MKRKIKKIVDKILSLEKNVLLMVTGSSKGILERLVPVLLILTIVLAFVVGVLWQKVSVLEDGKVAAKNDETQQAQPTQTPISLDQIKELFNKDVIKFGDADKKLLFVEVTDPSCPYCHAAAGKNPELNRQIDPTNNTFKLTTDGGTYEAPVTEMKKLVDKGEASLVVIFQSGHGSGEMAMKALYCAYEKGKYWEVHNLLYSNKGYDLINNVVQNDISQSQKLADFLKSAVDATEMNACLTSGKYEERILKDMELATSLGVSGTPGFFINTTPFAGAYNFTNMQPAVDAALGK
jgi:protein-disulfide isomerase